MTASSHPGERARAFPDRTGRFFAGLALATALLGSTVPARADALADKAAAEALFNHARALMKEGKYAEACPKLAESQRLDAGLGTMLYLADCYDKTGQTASAWTEFLDAAAVAHATGQAEREQKARERAAALESRLNRLSVSPASGVDVPGFEVRADGRVLDRALWGRPMPVDPGEHSVSASAPHKQPWSKRVQVIAADTATVFVVVPPFVDEAPPPPEPIKPAPPVEPSGSSARAAQPTVPEPRRSEPPRHTSPAPPSDTHLGVRRLGYTMIGFGLAGAAVGGAFGMVAILDNSDATPGCRIDNLCTPDAASSRTNALSMAKLSNIVLGAGGGVFAVGLVIALAARAPETGAAGGGSASLPVLHVGPLLGTGLGGISAGGAF